MYPLKISKAELIAKLKAALANFTTGVEEIKNYKDSATFQKGVAALQEADKALGDVADVLLVLGFPEGEEVAVPLKGLQVGLRVALKLIGKDPKKSIVMVQTIIKTLSGVAHFVGEAEKIVQKVESAAGVSASHASPSQQKPAIHNKMAMVAPRIVAPQSTDGHGPAVVSPSKSGSTVAITKGQDTMTTDDLHKLMQLAMTLAQKGFSLISDQKASQEILLDLDAELKILGTDGLHVDLKAPAIVEEAKAFAKALLEAEHCLEKLELAAVEENHSAPHETKPVNGVESITAVESAEPIAKEVAVHA